MRLLNPELIEVKAFGGGFYMGGAQQWFDDKWKRMSGCGPTAAAGILLYLARSRRYAALCDTGGCDRSGFLKLMNTMFEYVTPGWAGVNAGVFAGGIARYGEACGVGLRTRALNVPPVWRRRPTREALRDFVLESLREDLPLAFLNFSNGSLRNLNNWHWVMIIGLEPDSMTATICDCGGTKEIGLGEWLRTTVLGGGLVSVYL